MPRMQRLPIDPHLPGILGALGEHGALVLRAEPGAGKTTRVPPALLDAIPCGAVWVLEPRRLAARLAARRVATERGGQLGEEVGYQVRFDTRAGPRTRLRYMTEGILTRRLGADGGKLPGVAAVVLDEFHERHTETDLALTLLERIRREERPDLQVVVMSATLDTDPIATFLGAPVLDVPGRLHPVTIEHAPRRDERPLEDKVQDAVGRLLDAGLAGHVLVFLPGVGEIHRAERALSGLARAHDLALHPLHGRLPANAIDAALRPGTERRKVLLATNVAESSLTIDGVAAVVDSGLARVAGVSPTTGLPTLELQPIPRDSAVQRANRAGRQGPGRCLRLYTRNDHDRRPAAAIPELLRQDLAGPLLSLHAAGVRDVEALRWLDPPPAPTVARAEELLRRLGAIDAAGELSEVGRRLLRYPLPPRLARVVEEGARRGVGSAAAAAAALLSERSIRIFDRRQRDRPPDEIGPSDVLVLLDQLGEARRVKFAAHRLRPLGVDAGAARAADRARKQIAGLLPKQQPAPPPDEDRELLLALLAGHPDRVARRQGKHELALAFGGRATLAGESSVQEAEWLIVLDAADTKQQARVRLASAIEPEWLLELFPEALEESSEVRWDAKRERAEATWRLSYGGLVLEESAESGDPAAISARLRKEALAAGPEAFCDKDALESFLRRARFAREHQADLPELGLEQARETLSELCEGRRSFAELRQADLLAHLRARLGHDGGRLLERLAPRQVTLSGGRRCDVHYETRQPPWIKSRLQDFFGMDEGPRVARGQVPLVLHLLAPNKQAVSVTSDLAGFWERHYPTERRHLSRRYPKHLWPEDPRTAKPPRPGRIR